MRSLLLDRDGVINHDSPDFIRSAAEWHPLPGSLEAIARAQHAGYRVIVISNQSGLGRGLLTINDLHQIHARLSAELERIGGRIDAFFFCPHLPDAGCQCRKPGPGLLHSVAKRLSVDLRGTPFIGDRLTDAEAAEQVGARAMLVRSGITPLPKGSERFETFDDLPAAVEELVSCSN